MQTSFPIPNKYLAHLGAEELQQLSALMRYRQEARNKVLIPTGKRVKDVFYIQKGIVRLFMPDEKGREINTHLAWDGMFITSYYSLIRQQPSDESVITITACELFHFTYEELAKLFDPFPKVERLGRMLAEEAFSCLAERGRMLQTMTARNRYLHLMKTVPVDIFTQIPLQEIASFLGIAAGSLSRIRNELLHIC